MSTEKHIRYLLLALFLATCSATSHAQDKDSITTLDDLLRLADERSRSIKMLEMGLDVAKKDIAVAKNAYLPDATFSASAGYNSNAWVCDRDFSNGKTFSSPHFANSFGMEASMVVFAGGAIVNGIRIKEIKSQIAQWSLEEQRQQVYFLLTGYYLDYCKSVNLLEVLDKNIAQTRMMIDDMISKAEAGLVLENDITRYEVQLQNLLYNRKEMESSVLILHNRIATMLNLPEHIAIKPDSALLSLSMPHLSLEMAQEMASLNSPLIHKDMLNIELVDRAIAIAKSGYLPHINIFAGDNLKGPITYEIPTLNNNINVWYLGVGLSYSLSGLYKTPKEISKLSAARPQADMQLQVHQEEVTLNVHDSYVRYQDAFELLRTQETTLRLARENYDMMADRYANGLVLATDLVDADNLRLSAEVQLVNARINLIYNYYKLLYEAGSIHPENNQQL